MTATLRRRAFAGCLNLFVGVLPYASPQMALADARFRGSEAPDATTLTLVAAGLGLIQLALFWRMSGSPGFIFCGLGVKMANGNQMQPKAACIRAFPFIFLFVCFVSHLHLQAASGRIVAALLSYCVLLGLAISGGFLLFTGQDSLLDRLSGTKVVKLHDIKVI